MGNVFFGGGKVGMKKPGSRLPSGYTELAYIQSSGTQYIDTGFAPNQNTRVVFDFNMTSTSTAFVFGCRGGSGDNYNNRYAVLLASNAFRSDYGTGAGGSFPSSYAVGERHLIDKNKNVCYLDDATVTNTAATFQSPRNMFLCGANEGGSFKYGGSMKVHACQIYDNGTLIRDFVPCMSDANGVGLFDLVNNKFYGNAGSGSFVGSEVA